jgi:hypothetical protein
MRARVQGVPETAVVWETSHEAVADPSVSPALPGSGTTVPSGCELGHWRMPDRFGRLNTRPKRFVLLRYQRSWWTISS